MEKRSVSFTTLLVAGIIMLSAIIAGCSSQAPSASPVVETKLSTVDPAQLVLRPSEIPAMYILKEEWERDAADMNTWALDKGWKKGYGIYYEKPAPDARFFQQVISVYPAENITLIVPDTAYKWKNWSTEGNFTVEELLSPGIGDSSSALKIMETDDPMNTYIISFVKYDVYEEFWTNGTATDYEMLKQLATAAAGKIQ